MATNAQLIANMQKQHAAMMALPDSPVMEAMLKMPIYPTELQAWDAKLAQLSYSPVVEAMLKMPNYAAELQKWDATLAELSHSPVVEAMANMHHYTMMPSTFELAADFQRKSAEAENFASFPVMGAMTSLWNHDYLLRSEEIQNLKLQAEFQKLSAQTPMIEEMSRISKEYDSLRAAALNIQQQSADLAALARSPFLEAIEQNNQHWESLRALSRSLQHLCPPISEFISTGTDNGVLEETERTIILGFFRDTQKHAQQVHVQLCAAEMEFAHQPEIFSASWMDEIVAELRNKQCTMDDALEKLDPLLRQVDPNDSRIFRYWWILRKIEQKLIEIRVKLVEIFEEFNS